MKQQTKNRLKAVYIIYVLVILLYWWGNYNFYNNDEEQLGFVLFIILPIPIYYAVHFWTKAPKDQTPQ